MSPEAQPPADRRPEDDSWKDDRFGPEAAAVIDGTLTTIDDPDQALRVLRLTKESGAGFAAYLLLHDTDVAAENLEEAFHRAYVDAWEQFSHFRSDVLEGLGWLDAVKDVISTHGIPDDHLTWNHAAIDKQILDVYDVVRLDGWWHAFYK